MQKWPIRSWIIHYNLVEAGIVDRPEDYLYSSARNYLGVKGLVNVILLEPLIA